MILFEVASGTETPKINLGAKQNWIPACAGMTKDEIAALLSEITSWIPAPKAPMLTQGQAAQGQAPQSGRGKLSQE